MKAKILGALNWLDRRNDWQFVLILYVARWIVLSPIIMARHFTSPGAQESAAGASQLSQMSPLVLLLLMVVMSPLLETLIECSLPYFIISRLRRVRGRMSARPWGFELASAILMALFHPMLPALAPSFITGAFLAYCYGHFAARNVGQAILATTVFHGGINIVGWAMMLFATSA